MIRLGSAQEWAGGTKRSLEQGSMSNHNAWWQARLGVMPHPPNIIFSAVVIGKCNWAQPSNGLEVQKESRTRTYLQSHCQVAG